ncbi:Secretory pathway Sec39 [Macleaya cordata]|uniref:Secretory pathway Sec39 n=1 Tax=Macleaya cordata TaxID=56857 RepID=A0A200RD50_MACCD|nr:Secretory pathway Sec39 [Macleaya cordata]
MAEPIQEVLYETRYHANGSFSSNYPPLQQDEGVKGGFLSLLSVPVSEPVQIQRQKSEVGSPYVNEIPCVKKLKEKWDEHKHPRRFKKWMSIFVSPGGEHVAVASGNKITILRKVDDYKEPCGIFIGHDRLATFTHGAWSDCHDVLGVIDETDTLYFIKANGEQVSRITKKQLKVSIPIVGLIVLGDPDRKTSCLCNFSVLTSDGLLHHIEVGQEPSASVSSIHTSNKQSTVKNHCSQSFSCLDYHPESSLLVVVGSTVNVTENYRDKAGLYCISLWRTTRSLDLEPVFSSPQFEGLFSTPKGYVGSLTIPKVVISPQCKYVAVLDLTGKLDVFNLDDGRCSLSIIALDGKRNCLNDIADFTWWSDRILILAKMTGVVTMLDILSGMKLLENDPVFSMPVLERVQQCQGCVFLLESSSSEERDSHVSHIQRETIDMQDKRKGTRDRFDQLGVGKLSWSLMSFSERSVSEMYNSLISNQQYQVAMDFAHRHGLDGDEVLKSQWLHSDQGTNEINKFLSNIKDQDFVLSECLEKVGPTEDSAKALLSYGLCITGKFKFLESEDSECSKTWDLRMSRLQLLQFRDRLETFVGINMGRFSVQEYSKFRIMPLSEAAVTLAESGKIGALNLLFKRHPYSLAPFMLDILAAIPETIPVQTYGQLLPGRSPPTTIALRDEDWVECEKMVSFISKLPENQVNSIPVRTESIVKRCMGFIWPSVDELSLWYKTRARDIDSSSGQLDNCLYLVEFACRKGIVELQQFNEDVSYLYQLIYSDETDEEENFTMSLVSWEQLSDYAKFKMMINRVKEDKVVERLREKAIPFMRSRSPAMDSASEAQLVEGKQTESFLVRWLKEIASDNKLDICSTVIEDGCRDFEIDGIFMDEVEAVECALQCIYLCSLTDRWNTMASILSKLPKIKDNSINVDSLEKRVQVAEGHVEVGRLLAYYQVPKPIRFFLDAHSDEKGVKQIIRLILSKFGRRQPGRADNDWANMWRDMQSFQEKAFPFLDTEYMLMEFCRGLLKAGKFSLARNYLKGTGTVALATEKAENLVIQAAREYFFSASSLASTEIWKAKECLNIFPNSRSVKAEADIIDALTIRLPNLGVTLLPVEFRQIKDPMEIINMVITSQTGAYLNVDELIEIAKLLGLNSQDDIASVQEAVAREAAVAGDLQLAFDLCLVLAKKGHGPIWDLCAAIARGPFLDNMDTSSRKQLLGFALCHCDEESIGELLHAWKDLDMQSQCETLTMLSGTTPPNISFQGSSVLSFSAHSNQDIMNLTDCSVEGTNNDDQELHLRNIKNALANIAKDLSVENGTYLDSLLENGKFLSFAGLQLPWMLELSRKDEYGKKMTSDTKAPFRKRYKSVRTQALLTILSWLARNDIAPTDDLIASLAKSVMEPPVTEDEDILGCSVLLNLVDAFHGVEIIEEQLKAREGYQGICSIMNMGMSYSSLHNSGTDRANPAKRRELLLRKFQEKQSPLSPDAMDDKVQSTFWREWKSKLEEQKLLTDQSRELEQIMPGVDTARFFSRDYKYIENVIFSVIDAVKVEKKPSLKEVLKLADTYGLNRTEVLLRYLSSALVSEVWANDDIVSEISDQKMELLSCAASLISTISSNVYPVIDGCNKQRLSYIFGILSDCYLRLKEAKEPLLDIHSDPAHSVLELAEFYKILAQECRRVSFIKNLNFKNIAGLGGLNFECFNEEVYNHIDELNVEALAELVRTLVSIFPVSASKGLISWQSVYKHHVLNLLTRFVTDIKTNINFSNPDNFQGFVCELEQNYSCVRNYVRAMSQEDVLEITQQYCISSLPINWSSWGLPGESAWLDCLILLLKFWIRLTNDVHDAVSYDNSEGKLVKFNAESQSKCLKVFIELLMEDKISVHQGWVTVSHYVRQGPGGFTGGVFKLCRAMVLSGCGFEAITLVFSEALAHNLTSASLGVDCGGNLDGTLDLPQLYVNILDAVLLDLVNESRDCKNLHHLLSTLSKLEGNLEDLKRVRYAVWGRLGTFSDNMQLQSHIRVYALELMQSITGRNLRGLPAELLSNVQPWEGWDELCFSTAGNETANQVTLTPNQLDSSNRFTSTLVALKSTQLAATISPSIEVIPDDLLTLESAVSCFMNLSGAANTEAQFEALQHILEEWEGLFISERDEKDEKDSGEATDVGNNNWSGDEWDEGWESFQEEQPVEKQEKKEEAISVHPLHRCWMEVIKKLIFLNQFADVLKLIDRSLSKSNIILLDEEDVQSLTLGIDSFIALKLVLLLPYQAIHLQCLEAVEAKLKQEGSGGKFDGDPELFTLLLSSGIISTVATNSAYSATFSYVCYSAGKFSRLCQESQLSELKSRGRERSKTDESNFIIFRTVLFPCFVSELVKAKQPVLAGFLVSRFMHTNATLSLINVVEASLRRYLEGQMRMQESSDSSPGKTGMCRYLGNTLSGLREKLKSLTTDRTELNSDGRITNRNLFEDLLFLESPEPCNSSTRKWKSLTSENILWCNLFKERWGHDQAAFYAPIDSKTWKDVYEVQDRCDRVGLGLKIIREGADYYLVHQGEIQRHLGSRNGNKRVNDHSKFKRGRFTGEESFEGEQPCLSILDKILFFIGDLEVATSDAKRSRVL